MLLLLLMAACANSPQESPAFGSEEAAEEPATESVPAVEPTHTPVPLPTLVPTPDYTDISSMSSYAGETPEDTFDQYLYDSVAQQIWIQREKLDMRMRYQNPNTLLQDVGGLILDIDVLEDRSRRTILREKSATFEVEIDIRITYADGDTSSQSCAWTVTLEKSPEELWYVVNPRELLLFIDCA